LTADLILNRRRIHADRAEWWADGECHLEYCPKRPTAYRFVDRQPIAYMFVHVRDYRWHAVRCTWTGDQCHSHQIGTFSQDQRIDGMLVVEKAANQLHLFE